MPELWNFILAGPPTPRLPAGMFSMRFSWWNLPLVALVLCGCGDREKPAEPAAVEPPVAIGETAGDDPVATPPDPAERQESSAEQHTPSTTRGQTLGFSRFVPADAEALVTFQEIAKIINAVENMPLWQALADDGTARPFRAEEDEDDDFSDLQGIMHEENGQDFGNMMSPMDLFGSEVTLALGPGSSARLAAWMEFNRRSTYFQMRGFANALSNKRELSRTGMTPTLSIIGALAGAAAGIEIYGELVQDRAAMRALDAFQIPPIYLAVRADAENITRAHDTLSVPVHGFANFSEMVAPVEISRSGSTFKGYRLIGSDVADSMAEAREFMAEVFGEEVFDKFIDFVKTREIVALSGIVGDYAVLFFGSSVEEFQLAESDADAITAGETLAFADPQLEHPLHALIYGEENLVTKLAESAGGLADIALGLRDGFAANDRDGRNRDLVALLQVVAERERTLRALARHHAVGITLVNDQGPRVDAHGGTSGIFDFQSPAHFAALGDDPEVAVFLNICVDSRYSARSTAYTEAILETIYALLMRLMDTPIADEDDFGFDPMAFVRQYTAMFESEFRGDIVNIWRALAHDMRLGLGRESAIIIDLNGTVPALPGVPEALAGSANSPRIAYLAPVADRDRLASAWSGVHESASRITTRVGQMAEREFPMPKAISSESNGLSSWFLPLPYFDDEFLPSVTLDDSWFAIGSSRKQSVELVRRLGDLEPHNGGGMRFHVNFPLIVASQLKQLTTLVENRDAILETGKIDAEDFESTMASIESIARGLQEFERLEARYWEEDGVTRSRIHLRMKR